MILDTSALLAILRSEPEERRFIEAIEESAGPRMSAVNFVEAAVVIDSSSGHPARLNFGDCFAYALAKETAEPLLFKGNEFPHTDVTPAAW